MTTNPNLPALAAWLDAEERAAADARCLARMRRHYRGAPLDLTPTFEDPAPTNDPRTS